MPYAKRRVDDNQTVITETLKTVPGVSVAVTSSQGKGFPDIVVGYDGSAYLFELKKDQHSKLTYHEQVFKERWTGHYAVVWNSQQILNEIGVLFDAVPLPVTLTPYPGIRVSQDNQVIMTFKQDGKAYQVNLNPDTLERLITQLTECKGRLKKTYGKRA